MLKAIRYILSVVAVALCVGCNSDIFVEPVQEIADSVFTLDGNGGSALFTIPTEGLMNVRFDSEITYAGVNYFDKDGEYLANPTLANIAKVVYASPLFCLEFNIDGDRIEARALDNTTSEFIKVWVSLDYEYTTQFVEFIIGPGRPLEIDHLGYDIISPVSGQYTDRGIPHMFNNNSDLTQRIVIYPYKGAMSKIRLDIDDYEYWWARGVTGEIAVPLYSDGEWIDSETNVAEVIIGDITQFYSQDVDIDEEYVVEVPPHTKVTTVTTVTYAVLDVTYLGDLKQPGSGMIFFVQGKCQLAQPIAYTITEQ